MLSMRMFGPCVPCMEAYGLAVHKRLHRDVSVYIMHVFIDACIHAHIHRYAGIEYNISFYISIEAHMHTHTHYRVDLFSPLIKTVCSDACSRITQLHDPMMRQVDRQRPIRI